MDTPHELRGRRPQRQARGLRRAASLALIVAFHAVLASCSTWDNVADLPKRDGVTDPIRDADLRARAPQRTDSRFDSIVQRYIRPLIYPAGDSEPSVAQAPGAQTA